MVSGCLGGWRDQTSTWPPHSHPPPKGPLQLEGEHQKSRGALKDDPKDAGKGQILRLHPEIRAGFAAIVSPPKKPPQRSLVVLTLKAILSCAPVEVGHLNQRRKMKCFINKGDGSNHAICAPHVFLIGGTLPHLTFQKCLSFSSLKIFFRFMTGASAAYSVTIVCKNQLFQSLF